MTASELRSTPFSTRYPDDVEEWIDVYGFAVPLWLTDPGEEYDAIRQMAAGGARFTAAPPAVEGFGTFPVRAFARVSA